MNITSEPWSKSVRAVRFRPDGEVTRTRAVASNTDCREVDIEDASKIVTSAGLSVSIDELELVEASSFTEGALESMYNIE